MVAGKLLEVLALSSDADREREGGEGALIIGIRPDGLAVRGSEPPRMSYHAGDQRMSAASRRDLSRNPRNIHVQITDDVANPNEA